MTLAAVTLAAVVPVAVGAVVANLPMVAMAAGLSTLNSGRVLAQFTAGWLAGLTAITAAGLLLVDGVVLASDSAAWVSWLQLALGIALLVAGVRALVSRIRDGETDEEPGWVRTTRSLTGRKAFGTAFLLGSVNPKNTIIAMSAVSVIVDATDVIPAQIVSAVVFVVVASIGVAAPGLALLTLGDRARRPLTAVVDGFVRHSRIVTVVVLLLLGVYVAVSGILAIGSTD
ncbi:GAP family protein [Rhodococcoides yunnanense]|uniref:GAP family protein n=1 Tax=Rhodococcoides yunnanense TaxID=278209 RepID=UPI00093377A7|nr:GAP family protein [Rhodococcus yunnanensis]